MTLGEIAYNAYCAHRKWKSIRGEQLPSFGSMRLDQPEIAQAWEEAASAVAQDIALKTSRG